MLFIYVIYIGSETLFERLRFQALQELAPSDVRGSETLRAR